LLPFLMRGRHGPWFAISRFTMMGSAGALCVAITINGMSAAGAGQADWFSMAGLSHGAGNPWVFGALVSAAVLRTGIFPAHRSVAASLGAGAVLLSTLLMNAQMGLFLMARLAIPLFRDMAAEVLPWLFGLALFTCLYMAVLGLAERKPGALLATVFVSQSAGLFAGLLTATEGVTGALLQWIVLTVCATVLTVVHRCLQARTDGHAGEEAYMGLAARTPRFAVFFAVSALALVGMPGTLGFSGEDLLMHGALSVHPWLGAALPIAIALNAYHVFRLFARLFLGKESGSLSSVPDALPRERWALSACLVALVWLGVAPAHAVYLRAPAARAILGHAPAAESHFP
jgi:NADH-quinone oxidoreductase subunit M